MASTRAIDVGANTLADCFRMYGDHGFSVMDGAVTIPGSLRKSGKLLRRIVHHRESQFNGNRNISGFGIWDRTLIQLRLFREELDAAIKAGLRDPASNSFCIVGYPGEIVRIWDARKDEFWSKGHQWVDIPNIMSHPIGMR